jgi:transcriptional regulator with GAF, ATPase, and Fis domain
VRELLAEARSAAQAAHAAGGARIELKHLSLTAGSAFAMSPEPATATKQPEPPSASPPLPPTRARLVGVLKRAEGNASAAARELGVHRTQLRRWMERHGIDPRQYAPAGHPSADDDDG